MCQIGLQSCNYGKVKGRKLENSRQRSLFWILGTVYKSTVAVRQLTNTPQVDVDSLQEA